MELDPTLIPLEVYEAAKKLYFNHYLAGYKAEELTGHLNDWEEVENFEEVFASISKTKGTQPLSPKEQTDLAFYFTLEELEEILHEAYHAGKLDQQNRATTSLN